MIQKEVQRGEQYGILLALQLPEHIIQEYDRIIDELGEMINSEEPSQ